MASVPRTLRVLAGLSWRILVVVALLVVVGLAVARLRLVFLPVFAALLFSTFLLPPVRWLEKRGWPSALAALAALLVAIVAVCGVGVLVAPQVAGELDDLDVSVTGGVDRIQTWLVEGPLGLSRTRVDDLVDSVESQLRANASGIVGGALSGAILAVELVAGAVLALVLLFFFLKDGRRLWRWAVGLFPPRLRGDVSEVGARAYSTLGGFLRGTSIVALVDAVGIGLALLILDVPLVLPLAVLTFVGGFVPIVGAFVAGFAAVMVALVSNGFWTALFVFLAVLLVQQLEGNVLQPLIVGRSVELHPVAVLLAVTTGGVLWGVIGAFIAVPVAAAAWSAIAYMREKGERDPTPGRIVVRGSNERKRAA